MRYRLPPLNTLRLFEAAGRRLSFKLAAKELDVTPSAVSHGVQTLEDWLGTPLFHRSRKGLIMTAAGEKYLPAVTEALSQLASAPGRIKHGTDADHLHISATPTFGSRFLLSRLQRFQAVHPKVMISVDTAHRPVEFPRDGAHLAIRLGSGTWAGVLSEKLLTETLVPVCSPGLLDRLGNSPSLSDATIIHATSMVQDWEAWGAGSGHGPIDCRRAMSVDTSQIAIDAAIAGLGIAIARRPFVDPELESGALVRFDPREVRCTLSYWLVMPPESRARPAVQAFCAWLKGEIGSLACEADDSSGGHRGIMTDPGR
ncbi:MAG: LysR substrate-binding domain-containing protein [Hyphomicrobiaceae bacterium]